MELEPVRGSQRAQKPASIPTSGPAVRHRYVCPMHPEVTSDSPGTCPDCKMELEPVTAAPPQAPAPAVVPVVQRTFAGGATWLPETFPPADQGKPGDAAALATIKRRVFNDGVRAPAWLEAPDRVAAVLYRDEVDALSPGQRGTLYRALAPRVPIDVELSEEPPSRWDESTSIVRFKFDSDQSYRSGDVAWLEIASLSRELSVLPESAVLRSDDGPYVLVAEGGHFARRRIETGRTLKGHVVVLSGVGESEHVVVGGAFFVDIEHRHTSSAHGSEASR